MLLHESEQKKTKELTIFCPRPYLLINIYIIRLNGSIHAKHPIYVLFHSQFFYNRWKI